MRFALAAQVKLMSHPWPPTIGRLKVRMGIHTGTPFIDRDRQRLTYRGPDTNLASRVASAADGGEILVTESVRAATSAEFLGKVHFLSRGPVQLKGLDDHELFQVIASEQAL